jgi:hypothetical protein
MILAIDPGNEQSAFVILDYNLKATDFGKVENSELQEFIQGWPDEYFAIEMVASYGMAVGKEVFDTCVWIGRFLETAKLTGMKDIKYIYRKDEKINLCGSMKAKDANIRQALIDRFGVVGTKKNPGWFYGFKADIWQAYAVGVTYHDLYVKGAK